MKWYQLLAIALCSIAFNQVSQAADKVQQSDDVKLPELRLTLPAECLTSSLSASEALKSLQSGTMLLVDTDGSTVELPVQCQTRGATAMAYTMKPSLTMKLRDAQDTEIDSCLLGIRSCSSWILDAMAIDRICMRNRVAFDIWNDMSRLPYETKFDGRNGTKGRFVELFINGNSYGIYCLSDRINRKLLGLKKPVVGDDGQLKTIRGALYKSGTTDVANQNEPGFFLDYSVCVVEYHNAWELKEPDDYACEAAWAPLLDSYKPENRNYEYVKQHYYLENLADNHLLVMALAIQDNWGNKNKYLSVVDMSATGDAARLVYTPWDLDTSLGGSYNGSNYNGNYTNFPPDGMNKNAGQAFSVCVGQNEYKTLLRNRWIALRNNVLSVDSVAARMRAYTSLMEQSGAWQRQWDTFQSRKSKPMLVENLSAEVEQVIDWYRQRHDIVDAFFDTVGLDVPQVGNDADTRKVMVDGTLRIIRGDKTYDLQGRVVSQD